MEFKNTLVNNNLSYRCIHRTCKTLLTISKEDVRKISTKEKNNKIKYCLNPLRKVKNWTTIIYFYNFRLRDHYTRRVQIVNKEHTCTNTKINKESDSSDFATEIELYAKVKQIIKIY